MYQFIFKSQSLIPATCKRLNYFFILTDIFIFVVQTILLQQYRKDFTDSSTSDNIQDKGFQVMIAIGLSFRFLLSLLLIKFNHSIVLMNSVIFIRMSTSLWIILYSITTSFWNPMGIIHRKKYYVANIFYCLVELISFFSLLIMTLR